MLLKDSIKNYSGRLSALECLYVFISSRNINALKSGKKYFLIDYDFLNFLPLCYLKKSPPQKRLDKNFKTLTAQQGRRLEVYHDALRV